jgi:cell division protein FtsL
MKNKTAFIFVLLANMVLLAHAVIPHHHHQQQVCVESTHCLNDEYAHTHESSQHNHHHDGSADNCCILKQAVFITTVQLRLSDSNNTCLDNHTLNFIILSDFGFDEFYSLSVIASCIPEISFTITSYVTKTLGLRAPPIC